VLPKPFAFRRKSFSKKSCNPIAQSDQQCQTIQNAKSLNDIAKIANSNTNSSNTTREWLDSLNNALGGNAGGSKPNDKLNDWEKMGTDEGGAGPPTGPGPGPSSKSSSSGPSPSGSGSTQSGQNQSGQTNQPGQTDQSGQTTDSTQTRPDTGTQDSGSRTGGSEEARALAQKLTKIPEGILAHNSGATPYVINQCIDKLSKAAVNLNQIKPGWKIYPSSIYRSDEKQTRMWDNSSKNEKYIARPKARGGNGSQHSTGNALDLKFVDANGRKVSMDSNNKALLRQIMTDAGMLPYNAEWWHFYCIKPFKL